MTLYITGTPEEITFGIRSYKVRLLYPIPGEMLVVITPSAPLTVEWNEDGYGQLGFTQTQLSP